MPSPKYTGVSSGVGLRPIGGIGIAPYGIRHDGLSGKGFGYFGPQTTDDGEYATEYSIPLSEGGPFDPSGMSGREIPTMVPGITPEMLQQILRGDVTPEIAAIARDHAMRRLNSGLSPFIQRGELRQPIPGAAIGGILRGGIPNVNGALYRPASSGGVLSAPWVNPGGSLNGARG